MPDIQKLFLSRLNLQIPKDKMLYFWQDPKNFIQNFDEEFIKSYEQIAITEEQDKKFYNAGEGKFFISQTSMLGLKVLLESVYSWTPEKELPWNIIHGRSYHPTADTLQTFNVSKNNLDQYLEKLQELQKYFHNEAQESSQSATSVLVEIQKAKPEQGHKLKDNYEDLILLQSKINNSNIFEEMIQARINFIEQNKDIIKDLLENHYSITDTGLKRYKDNLEQEWLDLMPVNFYFKLSEKQNFKSSLGDIKIESANQLPYQKSSIV